MKLKLPSITTSIFTLILLIIGISLLSARKQLQKPMTETQADECVDCVHYINRVEARIARLGNVKENPQFFKYAMDKSCHGAMYLNRHCTKFRREFRKDVERYMVDFENPFEACVSIQACR